ncbi:ALF repeat-containing protein [Kitasatospora sp. NPDC085895]|uniref:ALF repeat-containing protein n=1 Tax=Kitasatospora sp. NPDC085895 TaxID=3155057 RepID=UPI00344C1BE6
MAAVSAPVALAAAPASAEELPAGRSRSDAPPASDQAPAPAGGPASDDAAEQDAADRAEIERILADPRTGRGVREAATKALAGTPQDRRHFLTVELPKLRAQDNRVRLMQLVADPATGRGVREAARKAMSGTDAEIERFLTVELKKIVADDNRIKVGPDPRREGHRPDPARGGREGDARHRRGRAEFLADLPSIRAADDRLRVSQLAETGGPEVRKAALAALAAGTPEALRAGRTTTGQGTTGQGGTGTQGKGGSTVTPTSATTGTTTATTGTTTAWTTGTGATTGADRLASTGTDAPLAGIAAAGGTAVALGAAALVAARRRSRA